MSSDCGIKRGNQTQRQGVKMPSSLKEILLKNKQTTEQRGVDVRVLSLFLLFLLSFPSFLWPFEWPPRTINLRARSGLITQPREFRLVVYDKTQLTKLIVMTATWIERNSSSAFVQHFRNAEKLRKLLINCNGREKSIIITTSQFPKSTTNYPTNRPTMAATLTVDQNHLVELISSRSSGSLSSPSSMKTIITQYI